MSDGNVIHVNFRLTPEQQQALAEFRARYDTFDKWLLALRAICCEYPKDILDCKIAEQELRTMDGHIDSFLEGLSGPLADWYHDGMEPEAAFGYGIWFIDDFYENTIEDV